MLLEIILYVSLGFFAAVMLGLVVAPAIWNRAVVLTRQKVENALPLNLNEIQAEKDKMRAEFAMTSRRLELAIEELRDKASSQLIDLHAKRDETNQLNHANKENLIKIDSLETAAEVMRGRLEENRELIEQQQARLEETSQDLTALRAQHNTLRLQHSDTEEELNKTKIELVARESRVESLSATLSTLNLTDDEQKTKVETLHRQISQLKLDLKEEKQNTKSALAEAKSTSKKLQSAEKKLERVGGNSGSVKAATTKLKQQISDLTNELIAENAKAVDMEAKLAQYMLQQKLNQDTEAQDTGTKDSRSGEPNGKTLSGLEKQSDALSTEIREAAKGGKIKPARKKVLRGKLKDLAAETVSAIAATEPVGAESNKADKAKALQTAENRET